MRAEGPPSKRMRIGPAACPPRPAITPEAEVELDRAVVLDHADRLQQTLAGSGPQGGASASVGGTSLVSGASPDGNEDVAAAVGAARGSESHQTEPVTCDPQDAANDDPSGVLIFETNVLTQNALTRKSVRAVVCALFVLLTRQALALAPLLVADLLPLAPLCVVAPPVRRPIRG